jgi:hypothetical protein
MKIKCLPVESGRVRVEILSNDNKDYNLVENFLTSCNSFRSVLAVLHQLEGTIKGTYIKDETSQYDFNTEGVGLHIGKNEIQLEYIAGTPDTITLPIQDFLEATETYARFLNKHLKARHAKLDWGKEEVAENDKQLKAYFKNKNSRKTFYRSDKNKMLNY